MLIFAKNIIKKIAFKSKTNCEQWISISLESV